MITKLIKSLFWEAEKRTGKPNKSALAKDIHQWIYNNVRDSTGARARISTKTIERIYDQYVLETRDAVNRSKPNGEWLDYFSQYLGYGSYENYILGNSDSGYTENKDDSERANESDLLIENAVVAEKVETKTIHAEQNIEGNVTNNVDNSVTNNYVESSRKKRLILILSIITTTVVLLIYWAVGFKDDSLCLVWKQSHYEKVPCDEVESSQGTIAVDPGQWEKEYKDFKKIKLDKNTPLFDRNGQPLVWYVEHNNQLDFFNAKGLHPVSGKPLSPVTPEVVTRYLIQRETQLNESNQNVSPSSPENEETTPIPVESNTKQSELKHETKETTGKYCFKNDHLETIEITLNSTIAQQERFQVNSNEQICLFFPVGEYSFVARTSAKSAIVKQGSIHVTKDREGYLYLSESKSEKEAQPIKSEPEKQCDGGDLHITNNTNKTVVVYLQKYGKSAPLLISSMNITIHANRSGDFLGVEEGQYTLEIDKNDNFGIRENQQVRITRCEMNSFEIN